MKHEDSMASIERINHVALVVDDIEEALRFWRDSLGFEVSHVEDAPDQGSVVAFLSTGDQEIELVKPTDDESGAARYLKKRGPGLHHLCLEVQDIRECLERLSAQGVRLINDEPVVGTGGKLIAFIHPESTHGVLVELYELTHEEREIRLARAVGLADRAMGQGQVVVAGVLGFLRQLRRDGDRPQ
jgi:methylmalonyl-CoA/ethylmalonyl-CoA epimerase